MEFAGNEEKIQTLFRELKLEDEHLASGFGRLWNSVEKTTERPARAFKISFAVATSLLVIALCSLALWARTWQWAEQPGPAVANQSTKPGPTPSSTTTPQLALSEPKQPVVARSSDRIRSIRRARKLAAERQALTESHSAMLEARAISSWQAPTTMLMQSPAEDVLTSLPQLDQSITELKSFLVSQ